MKTKTIAGLRWLAWSPSLFELDVNASKRLTIAYSGWGWHVGLDDVYGTMSFHTREGAASYVALSFGTEEVSA